MGKCIVVTGGSSFLGKEMVQKLLSEDYSVAVTGRNRKKFEKSFSNFKDAQKLKFFSLDLSSGDDELYRACSDIKTYLGEQNHQLKGIVNNALVPITKDFPNLNCQSVSDATQGLFASQIILSQNFVDELATSKGSIVNIASIYGLISPKHHIYTESTPVNPLVYGALKAALIQSSRWLAAFMGPSGVRVNSISFGPFPSPNAQKDEDFVASLVNNIPLNRLGNPSEAAGPVSFLLSDDASFITGHNLIVDGGWTIS